MPEEETEQTTGNPTTSRSADCSMSDSEQKSNEKITLINSYNYQVKESLLSKIVSGVPQDFSYGLINQDKSKDALVGNYNDNAQLAIIAAYTDNEAERVKRQKWLLGSVVILTAIQLFFFNYVISETLTQSFQISQSEIINNLDVVNNLFEILKYYIGASVVELIGMIFFITKGTFSSDHVKTMELMLNKKQTKETE